MERATREKDGHEDDDERDGNEAHRDVDASTVVAEAGLYMSR